MIHTERPVIAHDGARAFDGYLARPRSGKGPGLLIFSEMWGVGESKTGMADDYAAKGWCAFVPNMFWRSDFTAVVPYTDPDKAWQRLNAFDWQRSVDDIRTAAQWLRVSPHCTGTIAAIGFCMGGRLSFLAGVHAGVDAAISLYALGIAKHLDEVRRIGCPLQLHYGMNDRHVPIAEIEAVAGAAQDNSNVEICRYPGADHAFFVESRPTYDAQAAALAAARIERLLARLH